MKNKKDENNQFLTDILKNHTESLKTGIQYYEYLHSYILLDIPNTSPMMYILIDYVTLYLLPLLGCDDTRLQRFRESLLSKHDELMKNGVNTEEGKTHLEQTQEELKEFGVNFNLNMEGAEQTNTTDKPPHSFTKEQLKEMIEKVYSYDDILDIFSKKKKKDDEGKGKKK